MFHVGNQVKVLFMSPKVYRVPAVLIRDSSGLLD